MSVSLPAAVPIVHDERLTLQEAADSLRVSTKTMRRWIRNGLVPAIRIGPGGRYMVRPDELRAAVERPVAKGAAQ